jgi:hypothetical protein
MVGENCINKKRKQPDGEACLVEIIIEAGITD